MNDWSALTQALAHAMRSHAPGWSDQNDADPGVTVLELIAYLAEGYQLHHGAARGGSSAALRAITALEAAMRTKGAEHWCGTKRTRFFFGRMLTAEDLAREQEYHIERHRRHLRTLHGSGVVEGLDVSVAADRQSIVIAPGFAIDAYGREICLDRQAVAMIPAASASPTWVAVEYAERPVDPVPVSNDQGTEATRIEEGCAVIVSPSCDRRVCVARLLRSQDEWIVDSTFAPARPR